MCVSSTRRRVHGAQYWQGGGIDTARAFSGIRAVDPSDCFHLPTSEGIGRDLTTNPRQYFDSLTVAEQDRLFGKAGAQAIRAGADISQVVNSRRGMHTASGGQRFTRESTTGRGLARPGRLMPEEIYRIARSRDEALALLAQHGYLRPTTRLASTVSRAAAGAPALVPRATLGTPTLPIPAATRPRRLTHDQAVDMQEAMLADRPWTREQITALSGYTGGGYLDANPVLRGQVTASSMRPGAYDEALRMIGDASAGMRPLPEPVTTWRRVDRDAFGVAELDELADLVDTVRQEPGFLSTSIRDDLYPEMGDVYIEVRAPAGTPAAYVDSISQLQPGDPGIDQAERELLFAPGRNFRILEAVRSGDEVRMIIEILA